jgi:hypothetical protein
LTARAKGGGGSKSFAIVSLHWVTAIFEGAAYEVLERRLSLQIKRNA